jgi:hypothetical protein
MAQAPAKSWEVSQLPPNNDDPKGQPYRRVECRSCAVWIENEGPPERGICTMHAPRPLTFPMNPKLVGQRPQGTDVVWPATRANMSCGQWLGPGGQSLADVLIWHAKKAKEEASDAEV